jgi:putative transposase
LAKTLADFEINDIAAFPPLFCYNSYPCFGTQVRLLRARRSLLLEDLALRQQLAVLMRRHPRPRLELLDKLFWVAVRRFWSGWQQSLIVVTPETVVRWRRWRFHLYWKLVSKVRRPTGRRQTSKEIQELILRMAVENSTWGAPRIHGELLMLGFDVCERTISRWMKRARRDPQPATRWLTFLRNHRGAIAAMDFFTVPTITFSALYCLFVISHDRRRILHFNVTKHPTGSWIIQQLREAFPGSAPRVVIFDRHAKYGLEVPAAVRSLSVGSCRRDLLDHIIAVDERRLKRLLAESIRYYHEDRTHLGLGKGTPDGRTRTTASGRVLSHVRLGGLHHRYERAA